MEGSNKKQVSQKKKPTAIHIKKCMKKSKNHGNKILFNTFHFLSYDLIQAHHLVSVSMG